MAKATKRPKPKPSRPKKRKRKPKKKQPAKPKQKRKRGPKSFKEKRVLFRGAGYEAKLRYEVDQNKSDAIHAQYRYGYQLIWRVVEPAMLKQLSFPAMGTFEKNNGQDGLIWGWRKECNMTNKKAGKLLLACIQSRKLTMPQLGSVRKSLAYTFQLMGNKVTKKEDNWPEVGRVWESVGQDKCVPTKSTLPTCIPTPDDLKKAFTSRWDSGRNRMSFLRSIVARRAASDIFKDGCRPNEDIARLKKSRRAEIINDDT